MKSHLEDWLSKELWAEVPNMAQYGGASNGSTWDNEIERKSFRTVEDAQKHANKNERIDFFFFTRNSMSLTAGKDFKAKGEFKKGEVVFFSGKPWWGSAPQADGYVKEADYVGFSEMSCYGQSSDIAYTAKYLNNEACDWLTEWKVYPQINVITVDFFHEPHNRFVNTIIEINRTLSSGNMAPLRRVAESDLEIEESRREGLSAPLSPGDDTYEAFARKTLSDVGLDWQELKNEYLRTGLRKELVRKLESKGIPKRFASEFFKAYDSKRK